ncbi:hypothetical protein AW14_01775 [Siansivirga zeaxanthinifaciens CC-SAMT-1]|uniref:Uncharacterized protein n=1 Tax=Siansivirga zeaxanthinifaciens CC-SAMT-1 TaxID=1454006 RepID=A0A0C5WES8_9FLAO|nr:hypothetical protein AW14_01775 [Siansivirga zeaxanthinifaciens CC-SAMT-1]
MLNKLKRVFVFGLLENWKLFSRAAYRKSNRILKLTSAYNIAASQHIYGFVPTTQSQIQI